MNLLMCAETNEPLRCAEVEEELIKIKINIQGPCVSCEGSLGERGGEGGGNK